MRKFKCVYASMFEGRVIRSGEIVETDTDLSGHVGFNEIVPVPKAPEVPAAPVDVPSGEVSGSGTPAPETPAPSVDGSGTPAPLKGKGRKGK